MSFQKPITSQTPLTFHQDGSKIATERRFSNEDHQPNRDLSFSRNVSHGCHCHRYKWTRLNTNQWDQSSYRKSRPMRNSNYLAGTVMMSLVKKSNKSSLKIGKHFWLVRKRYFLNKQSCYSRRTSVTRLAYFLTLLTTKFLTKVPLILNNFLGLFEKRYFLSERICNCFGNFYSNIWSHCLPHPWDSLKVLKLTVPTRSRCHQQILTLHHCAMPKLSTVIEWCKWHD